MDWWPQKGGRLVGIGGTIRNLAAATLKRLDTPDIEVQGFVLTRDALEDLIEELADKRASKRDSIPGIKPDRSDVILGGALALATMMDEGGFDELEVSEAGLREGIFFERLLEGSDPPLFEDVRRESVINLAHRYRTDDKHVGHVAKLSLQLFDSLEEAGVHDFGDAERELLWAACELHDIGVAIDYDDHHHHSAYLILNSGLAGLHQPGAGDHRAARALPPQGRPRRVVAGRPGREGRQGPGEAPQRHHPARRAAGAQPRPVGEVGRGAASPTGRWSCARRSGAAIPACRCGRRGATPTCWPKPWTARWRSRGLAEVGGQRAQLG